MFIHIRALNSRLANEIVANIRFDFRLQSTEKSFLTLNIQHPRAINRMDHNETII